MVKIEEKYYYGYKVYKNGNLHIIFVANPEAQWQDLTKFPRYNDIDEYGKRYFFECNPFVEIKEYKGQSLPY